MQSVFQLHNLCNRSLFFSTLGITNTTTVLVRIQRRSELIRAASPSTARAASRGRGPAVGAGYARDGRQTECGAPGWTEDGQQLQAPYAPENKDTLTMVEGLSALPLEEQRDYVTEQLVARLAKDPAARLRFAEQVERVQRGPE